MSPIKTGKAKQHLLGEQPGALVSVQRREHPPLHPRSEGSVLVGEDKGKWAGNIKMASPTGPSHLRLTNPTVPEDLGT